MTYNQKCSQKCLPLLTINSRWLPACLTSETMYFSDKTPTPKQESAEGKFYLNFGSNVGKLPLNPAEMYKTRVRKMLNVKLEEGDRPFKCPLCARCFQVATPTYRTTILFTPERDFMTVISAGNLLCDAERCRFTVVYTIVTLRTSVPSVWSPSWGRTDCCITNVLGQSHCFKIMVRTSLGIILSHLLMYHSITLSH